MSVVSEDTQETNTELLRPQVTLQAWLLHSSVNQQSCVHGQFPSFTYPDSKSTTAWLVCMTNFTQLQGQDFGGLQLQFPVPVGGNTYQSLFSSSAKAVKLQQMWISNIPITELLAVLDLFPFLWQMSQNQEEGWETQCPGLCHNLVPTATFWVTNGLHPIRPGWNWIEISPSLSDYIYWDMMGRKLCCFSSLALFTEACVFSVNGTGSVLQGSEHSRVGFSRDYSGIFTYLSAQTAENSFPDRCLEYRQFSWTWPDESTWVPFLVPKVNIVEPIHHDSAFI